MTISEAKARLLASAAESAVDYVRGERQGPVFPSPDAIAKLDQLSSWSLDSPQSPQEVVATLAELGTVTAVRSTGGRYFGFVTGGTEPAALAASVLASVWDQNGALTAMSPLAAAIDRVAAKWIVDLLGLPGGSVASFCGGASVANLIGVVAARDSLLANNGWSVADQGLRDAPKVSVVASAEAHVSATKALRIAGWGLAEIVTVPTDSLGRMMVGAIPELCGPVLYLAQVGNVNTGHSDPVDELAALVGRRHEPGQAWVHVDGAFGLWAAASPRQRHHASGIDLADSWATDAHKWLNTPYDCGVVAVRNGHDLRRAMSATADYLPSSDGLTAAGPGGVDSAWSDDLREPMHLGLQMSQAARSIPVFALLASIGAEGVADIVDRCCRHAEALSNKLVSAGAELLTPPGLNQALVRFESDDITNRVVAATQDGGVCWTGATTWQGMRAMRLSICDSATNDADIDAAAEAIIAAWRGL